jgi:hypothetical protein
MFIWHLIVDIYQILKFDLSFNWKEAGRNDPEVSGGRPWPCALIGFRRLDFFGYFFCQEKK